MLTNWFHPTRSAVTWCKYGHFKGIGRRPDPLIKPLYVRRWGYEEKILNRGSLPRIKDAPPIKHIPPLAPRNNFSPCAAVEGQNDYIDILGDGTVHPVDLMTHVPKWLRGMSKGRYEFPTLIRRQNSTQDYWKEYRPKKFYDMHKRLRYLWNFINQKTKPWSSCCSEHHFLVFCGHCFWMIKKNSCVEIACWSCHVELSKSALASTCTTWPQKRILKNKFKPVL